MTDLGLPPLPPADHATRRDRVRRRAADAGVEVLIVIGPSGVRYLTGFTGSNGQLLLGVGGDDRLVTDERYEGRAATEASDLPQILSRDWIGVAVAHAADAGAEALGFESDHVTWHDGIALIDRAAEAGIAATGTRGLVEAERVAKDEHELAALSAACRITDVAYAALLDQLRPGRTERELARWLERTMEDLGADGPAFPSIVASGPNSAIPHHEPTERALGRGDLLKVDFGACFAGYHADMTRTVAIGDPAPDLVDLHGLVREAQQRGVDAAVAGTLAGDVDRACREHLSAHGHGERFVHGTGHGVGLDIHEAPAVARGGSARLAPRTVITVEPGVYLAGRGGIRIEDTVVVTDDGPPRRLTTSPRDLVRL